MCAFVHMCITATQQILHATPISSPHNVLDIRRIAEGSVVFAVLEDSGFCLTGFLEKSISIVPEMHAHFSQFVDCCYLAT